MPRSLPVVLLIASSVMWGLTWWPLKYFNSTGLAGVQLILIAYGSAGLLMSFLIVREWRQWQGRHACLLLFFIFGGYANLAFASAMVYGDVVRAMMLFYLGPVWGVLGGRFLLNESIDRQRGLGIVFAMGGAWLILGGETLFTTPPSMVDILALTAGMAFALNNISFRATQAYPTGSKVAAMFIGCGMFAAVLMPVEGISTTTLTSDTWLALLAFGLIWLLGATAMTQWSVTHMEAGRAAILLITELLVAVISATLIGGETMSTIEWIGGALILTSTFLEAWRPPTPARALST